MKSRQGLPLQVRRRFQSGRVSIDFTHTGGEGDFARWEMLHSTDDLARYLGVILDTHAPAAAAGELEPARRLRSSLTNVARDVAAGHDHGAADIDVINEFASAPPLAPKLSRGLEAGWVPGDVGQALSTLARDGIELLASPLAERIGVCAAPDCQLLFVDESRPGRRRWCSMEWCGDRAKKRRHRGTNE